ncbi:MAG: flagellar hook-length control protein FliK [Lachnospiraceae bacterium]|nr:flagellar hook-length control protein FliK [Lachnospiraceae bacterium]
MAIDLLNSFLQRGKNISSNQKSNVPNTTQTTQSLSQNLQVIRAVRALQAGQTIQGEIVSVKGDEVQLAIMKDVLIDARLAQSMNLTPGMTMPFQVKANTSQGLSLIPLFTNTAADPNALKALDMAQIPVNDRSLAMVQSMMEKGMSIDKQSVQEMYRDITAFKDAVVRDIVSLHQMQIPVSEDNLTQFSLYRNNQHYLKDAFQTIGNAIGEQLEGLVEEGNRESAIKLIKELSQLFQNNGIEGRMQNVSIGGEGILTDVVTDSYHSSQVMNEDALQAQNPTTVFAEQMIEEKSGLEQGTEKPLELLQESDVEHKVIIRQDNPEQISEEDKSIKKHSVTEKIQQNAQGISKQPEWEDLIKSVIKDKDTGKIVSMFEKIWDKAISKEWFLEPESVLEKKNVKEFYEKLTSQLKQLEQIFKENGIEKSPAAKTVQNTVANLDFMNQMNQIHAYIQLPLKMANQNAHGELYIFANKRSFNKHDGKVTALLHLDMEHLGKMDVYVALENQKVNTNFYLEKEEYLDFLESHMDMLTARLNKRGYTCDIKATLRNEDAEPVIASIEKQQGQPMLLSMQAFDVRA